VPPLRGRPDLPRTDRLRVRVCTGGICQAPACPDGVVNGDETDIDCGGPACPPCVADRICLEPTDCASGVCTGGICQAPECPDGVVNGDETDLDCGGPACPPCETDQICVEPTDCASGCARPASARRRPARTG